MAGLHCRGCRTRAAFVWVLPQQPRRTFKGRNTGRLLLGPVGDTLSHCPALLSTRPAAGPTRCRKESTDYSPAPTPRPDPWEAP